MRYFCATFTKYSKKKSRFLLDDDLPNGLLAAIRKLGWNATTRREVGSRGPEDEDLLALSQRTDRILLTSDLDFRNERRFPPHRNPEVVILPSASQGESRLVEALSAVLRIVGSYRELFRGAVVEVDGAGVITLARRAGGWPLLVPQGEARLAGTVGPKAPPISVVLLRNHTAVRRVIGLKIR